MEMPKSTQGIAFMIFFLCTTHVAVAQVPSYYYVGCYKDLYYTGLPSRPLPNFLGEVNKIPDCAALAFAGKYLAFSLQNGVQCFATNSTASAVRDGPVPVTYPPSVNDCAYTCAGDPSTICGGPWANSLFFFSYFTYVGCYVDQQSRQLEIDLSGGYNACMTVQKCAALSKVQRLKYFATQDGGTCFATNSTTKPTALGTSTQCLGRCAGNTNQYCGGPYLNSLYVHTYI